MFRCSYLPSMAANRQQNMGVRLPGGFPITYLGLFNFQMKISRCTSPETAWSPLMEETLENSLFFLWSWLYCSENEELEWDERFQLGLLPPWLSMAGVSLCLCLKMMESTAGGWPQITFYESTKSDIVPGRTTAQHPGSMGDLDLINTIASCTVSFRLTLYGSHHRIVFVCADRR